MANLTITGLGSLDGSYEFDDSRFTMGDLRTIKRIAGVRAGELTEALEAGDTDLMVAIAVIALERNGVTVSEHDLWGADLGQIDLALGDGDVSPPERAPDGSRPSSGEGSKVFSESRETTPQPIGDRPSGTTSISDREISPI